MKRHGFYVSALIGVLFFASAAFAVEIPPPTGYLNDFAGVLQPAEREEFNTTLKKFEDETSTQIFVVVVNSFQGLDRFSFAQEIFTKWKIGQEGKNNGILLTWGPRDDLPFPDKGEIFVNVGAGLEGVLTDSVTGGIIRQELVPRFKEEKYAEGLRFGLLALMRATKSEGFKPENADAPENIAGLFQFFLIFIFFVLNYGASFLARSKSWWLGGVLGTVGGGVLGFVLFQGFLVLIPAVAFGAFGLFLDYLLSKNYQKLVKAGRPTDFWHTGGGFLGGRGGFGGGGFGGFGGGGGGFSRGGGAGGGY